MLFSTHNDNDNKKASNTTEENTSQVNRNQKQRTSKGERRKTKRQGRMTRPRGSASYMKSHPNPLISPHLTLTLGSPMRMSLRAANQRQNPGPVLTFLGPARGGDERQIITRIMRVMWAAPLFGGYEVSATITAKQRGWGVRLGRDVVKQGDGNCDGDLGGVVRNTKRDVHGCTGGHWCVGILEVGVLIDWGEESA